MSWLFLARGWQWISFKATQLSSSESRNFLENNLTIKIYFRISAVDINLESVSVQECLQQINEMSPVCNNLYNFYLVSLSLLKPHPFFSYEVANPEFPLFLSWQTACWRDFGPYLLQNSGRKKLRHLNIKKISLVVSKSEMAILEEIGFSEV